MRAGCLGWSDDDPVLVDPHSVRHINHVEQLGDAMLFVDQTHVTGVRLDIKFARRFCAARFLRDSDDNEVLILNVVVNCLPHGQVVTASSP